MNRQNKLATMPIRPLLYTMAVPLMLSLLVQSLYNIVDSMFVARLSEDALTAASLVYSIQFLMIAVSVGTAVGLNALLSRKIGQQKTDEACRAATTGLFLTLFTSFLFSIAGIFFSDVIASKLTPDPTLQELCKQYLSINLVYCWGMFLQTYGQRLLQAVGDTVLSMLSLIIGNPQYYLFGAGILGHSMTEDSRARFLNYPSTLRYIFHTNGIHYNRIFFCKFCIAAVLEHQSLQTDTTNQNALPVHFGMLSVFDKLFHL